MIRTGMKRVTVPHLRPFLKIVYKTLKPTNDYE